MLSLLAALPFSVLVLADLLVAAWPEAVGGGEAVPRADDFAGVGVDDRGRARGGVTVDEVRRQVHQPCLALRGIDEKLGLPVADLATAREHGLAVARECGLGAGLAQPRRHRRQIGLHALQQLTARAQGVAAGVLRSEEHTSERQSLMRQSYAV